MSFKEKAIEVLLLKSSNKMRSAEASFNLGLYDSAVSDLYYSAFQGVCALMVSRDLKTDKHTNVRAFVNRELGLKGFLSLELSKMYGILMDQRADADYSGEVSFDKDQVEGMFVKVKEFNEVILKILVDDGFHKMNVF